MYKHIKTAIAACGLVSGFAVPGAAIADEAVKAPSSAASTSASSPSDAGQPVVPQTANPLGGKALDTGLLARQRGGTDPGTLSDMKLNGVVGSNNASNLTTGNNAISDGAFAGVNGVPLVVQNSGNNVLIQSATIINVQVK